MSLASRHAWATRAVASKRHFITCQGEVRNRMSRLRLSDMRVQVIAMYSRSGHSWDKYRLLPNVHAHRTLGNWYGSSARQDASCAPLKTDCYLCACLCPWPFPCLLLLPLPLPLNRCHATKATASNCRASANASSASGSSPEVPRKRRGPSHGLRRLLARPAQHRSCQICLPSP